MISRKRLRYSHKIEEKSDPFEGLPDDLVVCILSKICSSATCPSDFISVLISCKRFNRLGLNRLVLSKAGAKLFAIRAKNWSESAHRFLKQCVSAGSVEACYFLGMIRFYCLENRGSGASLMAKAAIRSHAPALYSLAVLQFNGSGGSRSDKDLRAGVAICARAAYLGHVDAIRELGHCLQDGYGVRQNIAEGRRLLVQANARELASAFPSVTLSPPCPRSSVTSYSGGLHLHRYSNAEQQIMTTTLCPGSGLGSGCVLWSDYGCIVPVPEPRPENQFLIEWFGMKGGDPGPGLRMCSHSGCGRPETRPHEFRRCSACGAVNYCSRGCQAHDWKLRHKWQCTPAEVWPNEVVGGVGHGGVLVGQGGGNEVVGS
ncbi:hypothetical protein Nepgr_018574 [Nepenthes gracilis]|uniref:MYND-type domain-containing protein n=1 Tax=Nepenthes gracilis TaxID=150966 RepID=A0AAD3SSH0_NEPGR|nr:hypothetical protein Nepgr_018574 [Nepenthes gracilis]